MKTIPLETSEKVYNLKMTTNALVGLQKNYSADLAEMEQLRMTLHALLIWENKDLTLEQAGDIMDAAIYHKGFEYLANQMEQAQKLYFGEELFKQFVGEQSKGKKK